MKIILELTGPEERVSQSAAIIELTGVLAGGEVYPYYLVVSPRSKDETFKVRALRDLTSASINRAVFS